MDYQPSKYSIELWNPNGTLLADLTGRAMRRRIVMARNQPENIEWRLNLNDWEDYCRNQKVHPRDLLIGGQTEVRIKRKDTYLCGGQLIYSYPQIRGNDQILDIKADGFLNLFKDRITGTTANGTVQEEWVDTNGGDIAAGLITQTQAKINGDFGVTIGNIANTGIHTKTYDNTNIKNALQNFTNLQTRPFDFEFTYDKVFNTYASIGTDRPDVVFEYPSNIDSIGVPLNATGIANYVLGKGQGVGSAAASYEDGNIASQLDYKLREKIAISNATDNSDNGLTNAVESELAAWAFPFEIPDFVVNGNVAPFITDYGIGDRVRVRIRNYRTLEHIDGLYRIEQLVLNLDEQDNEEITVKVSV